MHGVRVEVVKSFALAVQGAAGDIVLRELNPHF